MQSKDLLVYKIHYSQEIKIIYRFFFTWTISNAIESHTVGQLSTILTNFKSKTTISIHLFLHRSETIKSLQQINFSTYIYQHGFENFQCSLQTITGQGKQPSQEEGWRNETHQQPFVSCRITSIHNIYLEMTLVVPAFWNPSLGEVSVTDKVYSCEHSYCLKRC